MGSSDSLGARLEDYAATVTETTPPATRDVPRYVGPLPEWLENVGLRLSLALIAVNLVGAVFGFLYYAEQLMHTHPLMWPIVPVSPLATLYMALSLFCWRRGYGGLLAQLVHVLAFVGCVKYGLWSVYVQLFIEDASQIPVLLWQFLLWSHAAMVLQAFLIYRYARFPLWAVGVVALWYALNDLLDFFVSVLGGPHHTWLFALWDNGFDRTTLLYDLTALGAVVSTVIAVGLSLVTWYVLCQLE